MAINARVAQVVQARDSDAAGQLWWETSDVASDASAPAATASMCSGKCFAHNKLGHKCADCPEKTQQ